MAIDTYTKYKAARKRPIEVLNFSSFTTIAVTYYSCFNGTLAGANTANGVVPTGVDVGLPNYGGSIAAFDAGETGYISRYWANNQGANSSSGIQILFDMLFKAGAYAFNANTVLASQPSYAARVPGGTDFTDCEIWIETVTAFTGNLSVTVTYTNESGVTGRTAGAFAPAVAPAVRRSFRLPLQSGDTGVQRIESVVSTTATAGTFNVLVLRRLGMARNAVTTQQPQILNFNGADALMTGMVEVFSASCLTQMQLCDATTSGQPYYNLEVVSG